MWWREFHPRSRPVAARGGIKAQSKRGTFGATWWGRRWVEVLESFPIGARLQRGRSYARGGQVLSIDFDKAGVKAKVQGSRPTPYQIQIQVAPHAAKDWTRVTAALTAEALNAAKLLAGEMPPEVEEVFKSVGLSLFPKKADDLTTDCSCPDWSNPCKHVAAVYYLLAEEFDRDPFLLFRLRGLSRDDLLKRLRKVGPVREKPVEAGEPLPADPAIFWAAPKLPDDFFGPVQSPPAAAALPKRLGAFPFWRGNRPVAEALEAQYRAAAARGLAAFLGDRG